MSDTMKLNLDILHSLISEMTQLKVTLEDSQPELPVKEGCGVLAEELDDLGMQYLSLHASFAALIDSTSLFLKDYAMQHTESALSHIWNGIFGDLGERFTNRETYSTATAFEDVFEALCQKIARLNSEIDELHCQITAEQNRITALRSMPVL